MKTLLGLTVIGLSVIVMTGCSEKKYTVDELYENSELLDKVIAECKQKAEPKKDSNCVNAAAAHRRHFSGSGGKVHQWK